MKPKEKRQAFWMEQIRILENRDPPDEQMTDVFFLAVGAGSMETYPSQAPFQPHSAAWAPAFHINPLSSSMMASEVGQRRTHSTDGNMRDRRRELTELTKPLGGEPHTLASGSQSLTPHGYLASADAQRAEFVIGRSQNDD